MRDKTERLPIAYNEMPTVYVNQGDTSMSMSFGGLSNIIHDELRTEVRLNHLYIFFNKKRDKVKMLFADKHGKCIIYKALDTDVFEVEHKAGFRKITAINPQKLLTEYINNGHKETA